MRHRILLVFLCAGILGIVGCSGDDTPQSPGNDSGVTGLISNPSFDIGGGTACLGDFVWADLNQNGIQDPGEPGIEGVTVYLLACKDNSVLCTTVTDENGYYEFAELPAGEYKISFDAPEGYTPTLPNQGKDDTVDSDCGVEPVCIKVGDKTIDKTWDCGLIPPLGCRVTGGGVDENGNYNGGMDNGMCHSNRYEFGGEAGANTAQQPQPKGEWQHHQQTGYYGSFSFHGGTSSAIEGTEIDEIVCSDPGFCDPARPAPAHQIDFWGVGYFTNMRNSPLETDVIVGESLHWFSVNIDDSGEPGRGRSGESGCPVDGFGLNGSVENVDCQCPDFYRITIHQTSDPSSPVIYMVWGYINGNLQIHPPTGFDTN